MFSRNARLPLLNSLSPNNYSRNVPSSASAQGSEVFQKDASLVKQPSYEIVAHALSGSSRMSATHQLEAENVSIISGLVAGVIAESSVENTDEKDMEQRDGVIWECVKKIVAPEGNIYRYRLRNLYDPMSYPKESDRSVVLLSGANKTLFPAVEASPVLANWEYRTEFGEREWFPSESQRVKEVIKELGYKLEFSSEGVFAEFPEKEIIESRWRSIMDLHPDWNLKMLSILSSEKIAGDREFLDAFYGYDVLLSTGNEFVHDHQLHVLSAIIFIVNLPQEYVESRAKTIQAVKEISEKIEIARDWLAEELTKDHLSNEDHAYLAHLKKNLEQADVIPSIFADIFTATPSPKDVNSELGEFYNPELGISLSAIKSTLGKGYTRYLRTRFPDREISMPWLCDEIEKILAKVEKK